MDKSTQFSIVAAMLALEDSKLKITEKDSYSTGVIIGSGIGGIGTFEKQHKILLEKGPGRVSPFFIPMMISNISAGEIAIKIGAKGPNGLLLLLAHHLLMLLEWLSSFYNMEMPK